MKTTVKYTLFVGTFLFLNLNLYGLLLEKPHLEMSFQKLEKIALGGYGAEYSDTVLAEEVLKEKYRHLYAGTPNAKWDFNDMELWLQAPKKTKQEKKRVAQILIKKYLAEDRPQEAIWTLRAFGLRKKADKIEKELLEFMSDTKLNVKVKDTYSANSGYIYRLILAKGRLRGVFRFGNSPFKNEVLAYHLDRLLGLDIVPMTVLRNLQTEEKDGNGFLGLREKTSGSLQYYVRGSCSSCVMYSSEADFRQERYPRGHQKMWLLDYLLDNKDKHQDNWRKRYGNRPFTFDYEQILGKGLGLGSTVLQEELLPKGELLERLVRLSSEKLLALDLDINVSSIFKKRENVLQEVAKKHGFAVVCRALF